MRLYFGVCLHEGYCLETAWDMLICKLYAVKRVEGIRNEGAKYQRISWITSKAILNIMIKVSRKPVDSPDSRFDTLIDIFTMSNIQRRILFLFFLCPFLEKVLPMVFFFNLFVWYPNFVRRHSFFFDLLAHVNTASV